MHNVINFENTQNAFHYKSDRRLRKAAFIYTIISKAWLVKLAKPTTNFLLRIGFPIDPFLKHTVFEQFCGGETISSCQTTVNDLYKTGKVHSILDYSVEGKTDEAFFDHTLQTMLEVCRHAMDSKAIPFLVFKPTGLGRSEIFEKISANETMTTEEIEEWHRITQRFDTLCSRVATTDHLKIMIDAEESWLQNAVDLLVEKMMLKHNVERTVIYTTVQMYRWDRLKYLQHLHAFGNDNNIRIGIKLVRGAYMEKERERARIKGYKSPICSDKRVTDLNFDDGISFAMDHLEVFDIFIGTHNEISCRVLIKKLMERGLKNDDPRIWFGQLYGMSDHISYNLSANGYNTSKYVPFGTLKEVIPYLFRRAEENTSVGTQTSRELSLIKKEIKRRKKAAVAQ